MKTIQIDKARFWDLIRDHTNADYAILVSDLIKVVRSLSCANVNCDNECRYDSGYCSLCDMKFNSSNGKRITHPEPE